MIRKKTRSVKALSGRVSSPASIVKARRTARRPAATYGIAEVGRFVDPGLVDLLEPVADQFETVEAFVVLGDHVHETSLPNVLLYEDLLAKAEPVHEWPELDERSPMMFCYTSGTTGNPKGVAYTQRSTYLHSIHNLANLTIKPTDNVVGPCRLNRQPRCIRWPAGVPLCRLDD